MKIQIPILLAAVLALAAQSGLRAHDNSYRDARTGTVGLRLDGGTSWSFGSSFENVGANQKNLIQPFGGTGIIVNIRPWVRLGADYSYTRMIREQVFSSIQSPDGAVYRDFKTRFHGASLTGEFNLMEIGHPKNPGRFSIWVGIGAGCLFSQGNTWTISVSDEMKIGTWTQTVHFGGVNVPHCYNSIFIPVALSLEYAFLPQLALSVGGAYRYIPVKTDPSPRSQAYAKIGLVFNMTGRRYRAKHSVQPAPVVPVTQVVHDTTYVETVVEKLVEVPAGLTDDMLPYVTFKRGSAKLDKWVNASSLSTLVTVLKAHPDVKFNICGWTDHTGGDAINGTLSKDRAEVLRDYLVEHGIQALRIIEVQGRGKYPMTGGEAFSIMARRANVTLCK